jgi:REP element-mobilizing transposase RayT
MKSIRLREFDYSGQNQAFFLTLRFVHSLNSEFIKTLFEILPKLFDESSYACDILVIMPDHLHLIAHKETESAESLGDLVCRLKSKSLYLLKKGKIVSSSFWQRGYYEHVIRNERDFQEKTKYVMNNPVNAGLVDSWEEYIFLSMNNKTHGATQGRPLRGGD